MDSRGGTTLGEWETFLASSRVVGVDPMSLTPTCPLPYTLKSIYPVLTSKILKSWHGFGVLAPTIMRSTKGTPM